jgi:hypothetical protein
LSGISVSELEAQLVAQVEPQLSAHFDQVLTESIMEKLGELDGVALHAGRPAAEAHSDEHQLSGDDDEGDGKSLEEQVQVSPPLSKPRTPVNRPEFQENPSQEPVFDFNVPDVGDDPEAFTGAAMAVEAKERQERPQSNGMYGPMTGTSRAFDSRRPRVRISEHNGDESGLFS